MPPNPSVAATRTSQARITGLAYGEPPDAAPADPTPDPRCWARFWATDSERFFCDVQQRSFEPCVRSLVGWHCRRGCLVRDRVCSWVLGSRCPIGSRWLAAVGVRKVHDGTAGGAVWVYTAAESRPAIPRLEKLCSKGSILIAGSFVRLNKN